MSSILIFSLASSWSKAALVLRWCPGLVFLVHRTRYIPYPWLPILHLHWLRSPWERLCFLHLMLHKAQVWMSSPSRVDWLRGMMTDKVGKSFGGRLRRVLMPGSRSKATPWQWHVKKMQLTLFWETGRQHSWGQGAPEKVVGILRLEVMRVSIGRWRLEWRGADIGNQCCRKNQEALVTTWMSWWHFYGYRMGAAPLPWAIFPRKLGGELPWREKEQCLFQCVDLEVQSNRKIQ